MRIRQRDSQNLVIVDFPWITGAIAFSIAALTFYHFCAAVYQHKHDQKMVASLIATVLFFLGGALFGKRSEFRFDRANGTLTWRRRGLISRKGGVVPLDQIKSAMVQLNDSDGTPSYRIALKTNDGHLPLTDAYTREVKPPDQIRDAINEFLNVATTQSQQIESEILDLAIAGKKIDAIRLARQRYGYDLAQAKNFVEQLIE